MSTSTRDDGAYVRLAKPEELHKLSLLSARAFRNDEIMNWMGSVAAPIPENPDPSTKAGKSFAGIQLFYEGLLPAIPMSGGIVTVVARPNASKEGKSEETLVSCALWTPSGKSIGNPITVLRSGLWKSFFKWGWTGLKRTAFTHQSGIDEVYTQEFKKRGRNLNECWHLISLATDPAEEGNGYGSMLIQQGILRSSGLPILLDAGSVKNRDMYVRRGFEVLKELRFSVGEVTQLGHPPRDEEKAEGVRLWVMARW